MKDLEAAQERLSAAYQELSICKFWQSDKKAAASTKIETAEKDSSAAFDTLVKYGISAYLNGVKMDGRYLSDEKIEYIRHHTKRRIDELQSRADSEARFARPSDALKGSHNAQSAARERFIDECRKIPPSLRKEATEALGAALLRNNIIKGDFGLGNVKAIDVVKNIIKTELPSARALNKVRDIDRDR